MPDHLIWAVLVVASLTFAAYSVITWTNAWLDELGERRDARRRNRR